MDAHWVLGNPRKGWDFGGEDTREQWGARGSSSQTTWDQGGRFLSHLEGAKLVEVRGIARGACTCQ